MSILSPQDDFIHQDYPRQDVKPWKENWYFNFIDRKNQAWGINHISLQRNIQKGRFTAMHVIDGETIPYVNEIDLDENFSELTDGNFRVDIIEPHRKYHLTFNGPSHSVSLNYEARFELFDYAKRDTDNGFKDEDTLAIEHYEQGMLVSGTIKKDEKSRSISCFGHRDHSWGYRNEENIRGWNWIAAQFPSRTINLYQLVVDGSDNVQSGFVSTGNGNIGVQSLKIVSTKWDENNAPLSATYEFNDENDRIWTMTSKKFSGIFLPMNEEGAGVHEVFSEFILEETGEKGEGIDEHLVNPAP